MIPSALALGGNCGQNLGRQRDIRPAHSGFILYTACIHDIHDICRSMLIEIKTHVIQLTYYPVRSSVYRYMYILHIVHKCLSHIYAQHCRVTCVYISIGPRVLRYSLPSTRPTCQRRSHRKNANGLQEDRVDEQLTVDRRVNQLHFHVEASNSTRFSWKRLQLYRQMCRGDEDTAAIKRYDAKVTCVVAERPRRE